MDIPTFNIIKGFYNENIDTNKRQLVYRYFRENIIVENIRAYGEIHTPTCLVNDMLDTIPNVDFWTKSNTVYDPCCGKGAFQLGLIDRFFNSMVSLEPLQRITHIINDLLFINDLNHLNVEITIQLMELHCKYLVPELDVSTLKFNFTIGDAIKQVHNEKYALICANPPFNNPNCLGRGGYPLYCKFIIKALEIAVEKGYILFVNPPAWRAPLLPQSRLKFLFNLMTKENQMISLVIKNRKSGEEMFGCDVKHDYYLIQKTPNFQKTKITDLENKILKINLSDRFFIPNFAVHDVMSLIARNDEPRLKMLRGRSMYCTQKKHMSPEESPEFRYKCLHTTPKKGNRFFYSNVDLGHFGVPKVIFGSCGLNDVIVDFNGDYGVTEKGYGILIESVHEGEMIKKALLSDKFKRILDANLYSNFGINYTIFENYRADFYLVFI